MNLSGHFAYVLQATFSVLLFLQAFGITVRVEEPVVVRAVRPFGYHGLTDLDHLVALVAYHCVLLSIYCPFLKSRSGERDPTVRRAPLPALKDREQNECQRTIRRLFARRANPFVYCEKSAGDTTDEK